MSTPMLKLIWPTTSTSFLERGAALLAGPAVREADTTGWTTPAAVLEAHGLDATGASSVDLLRFTPTPVTRVSTPAPGSPTFVAGHENGFLRGAGAMIPVWDVAPTEIPRWAELTRLHADGRIEPLSTYAGPALGWRRKGSGYAFPSTTIGVRAIWNGDEYHASWVDASSVELVAVAEAAPEGFTEARPNVFRRIVDASSCTRVFEISLSGIWNGPHGSIPCTIVSSAPEGTAVLLHVDTARATAIGALALEAGVFVRVVPPSELSDVGGTTTEWEIPAAKAWQSMPPREVADLLDFWAQATWPLSREEVHAMAVERFGWTTELDRGTEYLMNTVSGFTTPDVSTIGAKNALVDLGLDLSDTVREITVESTALIDAAFEAMVEEIERRWGPAVTRRDKGTTTATWTVTSGARLSLNRNDRGLSTFIQTPQGIALDKASGYA